MDEIAPGLGESQREVLDLLKRRGEATIQELEDPARRSRESLRDHLKSLVAQGLVERSGVRRAGPGRPALVYRLSPRGERLFPQRQGQLLGELAGFLLAEGRGDTLERFFATQAKARRPHLEARVSGLAGLERLREIAAQLDEEGFVAEVEESADGAPRLRLCHCPLRELVAVTHAPCRAEIARIEELLGRSARRESFIPSGGRSCTYSFPDPMPTTAPTRSAGPRNQENPR